MSDTARIGALHAESFLSWQSAQVLRCGLLLELATAEGRDDRYNPGFSPESLAREMAKRAREAKQTA